MHSWLKSPLIKEVPIRIIKLGNGSILNKLFQINAFFSEIPRGTFKIQCFPLYSILAALDNPTVDLLVLDMEGVELDVLRTLPWDMIDIQIINVEVVREKMNTDLKYDFVNHWPEIKALLESKGYLHYKTLRFDEIFIKDSFVLPDGISIEQGQKESIVGVKPEEVYFRKHSNNKVEFVDQNGIKIKDEL